MNVGIILSAGTSSRFKNKLKQFKQLFCINEIPVLQYSITTMVNTLDKIIIVTNSKCYNDFELVLRKSNYTHINLLH